MKKLVILLAAVFLLTMNVSVFGRFDVLSEFYSENVLDNLVPQTVFVVNTTGNQNDQLPGDGFCNDGNGNCSLRGAIQEANAFAGANQIDFNIGCGAIIQPTTALPVITETVTIDGYSQSGALPNTATTGSNAVICVVLDGGSIGGFTSGLRISAPNTVVRGLNIRRWTDAGIQIGAGNGSIIEGNFIGTDISGTVAQANRLGVVSFAASVRVGGTTLLSRNILSGNTRFGITMTEGSSNNIVQNNYVGLGATSAALGNGETGVQMFRSSGNTVGGATAATRNVISGNGFLASGGTDGSGVYILGDNINNSQNNVIQGNYIGTNPTGSAAIPNALNGVTIFGADNTTVGGTTAGARNIISGNNQSGVRIENVNATGNLIQGNYIGLAVDGNTDLGNTRDGVQILGNSNNTVGGTTPGAGNYISGNNGDGVLLNGGGTTGNFVQGNVIGTNAAGTIAVPNGYAGVEILFANGNTVGGTAAGARNYIAGNASFGIAMIVANNNTVQGNYVGISAAGATFSNVTGIYADGSNNQIGGTTAGAGNLISGNSGFGIRLVPFNNLPVTGNQVQGNLVGTNAAGTAAVPNNIGVLVQNANGNTIGGTTPEARNLISGNTTQGFAILNCNNNVAQGNYIGTTLDGTTALANGSNGVQIATSLSGTSSGNVIGGTAAGAGNVLSGNGLSGVQITGASTNNRVEGNVAGLNSAGNALPNGNHGVNLDGTGVNGTIIGGTAAGAGNVLSGNAFNGVLITNGANGNTVASNRIGTNAAGTNARSNLGNGVHILNASNNNIIGGADSSFRNLITGNNAGGVRISSDSTGNLVRANFIGTNAAGDNYLLNAAGTAFTSNFNYGILIQSPNNIIGGSSPDHRNVISGHFQSLVPGVQILAGGTGTVVQNNYIGTTADGTDELFNGQGIFSNAGGFTIDSNVISGSLYGIQNIGGSNGYITNNLFGTNAAGTAFLPNGFSIAMQSVSNVRIGEDAGGNVAPNTIAGGVGGTDRAGITITGNGTGNLIRQNSIYENAGIGIDLGGDGVTQNDGGDADLANNLQNFPVLTSVMTNIQGTLNSNPNRTFRLEFYSSPAADPSGYGEGRTFITNLNVTTDGSGNASFNIPNPIPVGGFISATATDLTTNDTSEFSALKQVLAPTMVKFAGAKAQKFDNGVLLEWQTGFEAANLGFNVYRETKGKRELVNDALVSGSALLTQANLQSGFDYQWFDANAREDAVYYVEAVDLDGSTEKFGAFRAEAAAGNYNSRNSKTIAESNVTDEQKTVFVEPLARFSGKPTAEQISVQNILANSDGVRLSIKNAGFYRVPAQQLFANGLPQGTNPNNLALYADGIEQPINIVSSENGAFEAIEFYGIGIDSTESDVRSYQLVVSNNPGRRLEKFDSNGASSETQSYTATVERRDRTSYFSGLLNGTEENFFGATVNADGVDQTLTVSNLAPTNENAVLSVKLQGLTRTSHSVRLELNGQTLGSINFEAMLKGDFEQEIPTNLFREGANTVRLTSQNGAGDLSLVENIRLGYPRKFRAVNNAISFTAESGREITVEGFTTKFVRVFDVSEANNVFELNPRVMKGGTILTDSDAKTDETEDAVSRSYKLGITPLGNGTRTILVIADGGAEVAEIERNFASNLQRMRGAAMLIITKRELTDAAEQLAKLRRIQGLSVAVVDVQDIYDEFNFGQKSAQAVKDYLQYAAASYQIKPQYVLLAGDATYDPKRYLGGSGDVVPTRLADTLTMETASDEWFGDFNNDGAADIAIGRLPALNESELGVMVDKIIAYERQTPINSMTFISDVSDGFDFAGANAAVREILPQTVNVQDIRRGETNDSIVRTNILNAFNSGQKIISYVGHGSTGIWRGNVFTRTDAQNLTNADRLPIVVTMTCLNGFFHDAINTGLSETLLKNPNGGAIAVLTSTTASLPDSYGALNVELHRRLLSGATLGQAHLWAKSTVANQDVVKSWTLLGDPSMRLR